MDTTVHGLGHINDVGETFRHLHIGRQVWWGYRFDFGNRNIGARHNGKKEPEIDRYCIGVFGRGRINPLKIYWDNY